jgi:CheY-like chemotaxis protein
MTRLLIVEDQANDLRIAADLARSIGFSIVDARSSAMAAKVYLENGLQGEGPLPEAIILDLDLGYESGFELMRFWHSNPRLSKIPLIIWTVLGDNQREICRLFKVDAYVSKTEDPALLRAALSGLTRAAS